MAVDPRLSKEQKRRLRRAPPLIPGVNSAAILRERGLVGLGESGLETGRQIGERVGSGLRRGTEAVLYGEQGAPAPEPVDAVEPVVAQRSARDARLGGYADTIRNDPGQFGLTRIYKSKDAAGNSVYSNIGSAPEGAETRYYNQYGNREGADVYGRVNPEFDPATTDIGLLVAAGHGRKSLDYAKRSEEARAELDRESALADMAPEDRRALLIEQMQQQGANQRASLDRGLRRELAGGTAQTAADKAFSEADRYERELGRENPAAALNELLGSIGGQDRDAQLAILSNPNDPRGARARRYVQQLISANTGEPNVNLGSITETGGLRRFFGGDRYTLNDGLFGTGVNPEEAGIGNDEDLQLLIDSYLNNQQLNRRR